MGRILGFLLLIVIAAYFLVKIQDHGAAYRPNGVPGKPPGVATQTISFLEGRGFTDIKIDHDSIKLPPSQTFDGNGKSVYPQGFYLKFTAISPGPPSCRDFPAGTQVQGYAMRDEYGGRFGCYLKFAPYRKEKGVGRESEDCLTCYGPDDPLPDYYKK